MTLSVPYFRQITNVHCGPAVTQMVLRYFNKPYPDQKMLGRIMNTDLIGENGTQHRVVANYLRSKGLVVRVSRNSSLHDIREALAEELPVIVHYIEPAEQDDHYAIVVGMTPSKIIVNDSWNGKALSYTHKEFLRRWHDKAGIYTRWMLVARPR